MLFYNNIYLFNNLQCMSEIVVTDLFYKQIFLRFTWLKKIANMPNSHELNEMFNYKLDKNI